MIKGFSAASLIPVAKLVVSVIKNELRENPQRVRCADCKFAARALHGWECRRRSPGDDGFPQMDLDQGQFGCGDGAPI
jgi:hypothetical protein